MHSGDLAVMNDDGYVAITGRIKDMIIRGGENIYPREIEEFLHTHEKVSDVQVIGVPDHKNAAKRCARGSGCVTGSPQPRRSFASSVAARSPPTRSRGMSGSPANSR